MLPGGLAPRRATSGRRRCRTRRPDNLWYRFIVSDGTDSAYYADDTPALDGGLGATSGDTVDKSYALMVYEPGFTAPGWAKNAVIYQIFPDRFRNGDTKNDPQDGRRRATTTRCSRCRGARCPRATAARTPDASTGCPWRFDATRPAWSPTRRAAGPRLLRRRPQGRDQKLDYLQTLGVNTIYFNPIFAAKLEPPLRHAPTTRRSTRTSARRRSSSSSSSRRRQRGMRVILDGVFNHMSSDSPFFDRYHHYATVGACESAASP